MAASFIWRLYDTCVQVVIVRVRKKHQQQNEKMGLIQDKKEKIQA